MTAPFNPSTFTPEQLDLLAGQGIVTEDSVTENVELDSDSETADHTDGMPEINQLDLGMPSAQFAFLAQLAKIQKVLGDEDAQAEDMDIEKVAEVVPEIERIVLNSAKDSDEMADWLSGAGGINRLFGAFSVISEKLGKLAA